MNTRTELFLGRLAGIPWFRNLGRASTTGSACVLTRATDAEKSFRSDDWSDFSLMLKNRNAGSVRAADWNRSQSWNEVAEEVRKRIERLAPAIEASLVGVGFREGDLSSISWDILNTAMEAEYWDILEEPFFSKLIWPWYEVGNLPCGWTGPKLDTTWSSALHLPLPAGKIIVF